MKKLNEKKLLVGAVAFVAVLGFINVVAVFATRDGMLAQVFKFGNVMTVDSQTATYGPAQNALGQNGIYFDRDRKVSVVACAAGGGGGGGDHGYETGSDDGAGGAGGGGGGKGMCASRTLKLRAGDTLRWLVGSGGMGGIRGRMIEVMEFGPPADQHQIATNGAPGGWTYVSINGIDVMQLQGGNGGQAGTHASDVYLPGWGGAGGSLDTVLQQAWGHRGENGQNNDQQSNGMGSGGYGGNGEGQNGLLTNRGSGGSSWTWGSNPHGTTGGNGVTASGGGGGGGGAGQWEDYDSNGDNFINTFRNWGGYGGIGGDGFVTITW